MMSLLPLCSDRVWCAAIRHCVLLLLLVTDAEADESKMDVDDGPASMDDEDTKDDAGPKVCTLTQVSAVCSLSHAGSPSVY